ncbi:MAG: hypothetical protein IJ272_00530 [Clostridia bacterium]|nr:hypothetical protein [Clostridia bacterium]
MRKWLGRIWEGVESGVAIFVVISVLNKLIFKEEDWLYRTLATCIPWIVAKPIIYYFVQDKKRKRGPLVVLTAICVFIGSLFVLGVCLSLEEYWWKAFTITFFSVWAMAFVQVDRSRDEKRCAKKVKEKLNVDVVV